MKLVGKIFKGMENASKTLEKSKLVLEKYDIKFPPFFPGTINVRLDIKFPTPNWPNILHIHSYEIDQVHPRYYSNKEDKFRECWELIPVIEINNLPIKGFIYRTTTNYWKDSVIELIAEDLTKYNIAITVESSLEIVLETIDK